MRTTIELDARLRGQLLELAAQRGIKGFSALIQEGVEAWLQNQASQQVARQRAAALRGSLTGNEGETLRAGVPAVRTPFPRATRCRD